MIAIVDYGRGNLGSVEKAFARLGMPAAVTQDPRVVDDARAVVLPGDGAFADCRDNLDHGHNNCFHDSLEQTEIFALKAPRKRREKRCEMKDKSRELGGNYEETVRS